MTMVLASRRCLRLGACLPILAAAAAGTGALAQEPGLAQTSLGRQASPATPGGDPQALSVGVPVRIQDALVTPFREVIFQTISTNTYVDRHGDGLSAPLQQVVKIGAAPGLGINLALSKNLGDEGRSGVVVTPSFQYVFNASHGIVPGVSIEGNYTPRPGTGQSGGNWGFSGQTTSNLGPTQRSPRLHLNLEWSKINDESGRARPQTLGYGIGLSALLSERTAVVSDVFYSQTATRRRSQTFFDIGLNHLLGSRFVVSAGGGVGTDKSTLALRVFLSFSTSLDFLNTAGRSRPEKSGPFAM